MLGDLTVGTLHSSNSLDDISIGSAAHGDGLHTGERTQQLGENGAGTGTVAIIHDDDVFCCKWLWSRCVERAISVNIDSTAIESDKWVIQIPWDTLVRLHFVACLWRNTYIATWTRRYRHCELQDHISGAMM